MGRGGHSGGGRGGHSGGGRGHHSSSRSGMSYGGSSRGTNHGSHNSVVIFGTGGHRGGQASPTAVCLGIAAILAVFLMVAIALVVIGVNTMNSGAEFGTVQGVAVDNTLKYSASDDDLFYYTTYRYTVDGTEYVEMSDIGYEEPETEGKTVTLYYKLSNPALITEEEPSESGKTALIIGALLSGLAIIGISGMMVRYSKLKKAEKTKLAEKKAADEKAAADAQRAEELSYCEYCGRKLSPEDLECPNCGASAPKR